MILFVLFSVVNATAQNSEIELDWELVNPFRYFTTDWRIINGVGQTMTGTRLEKRSQIYEIHLDALNTLKSAGKEATILDVEQELQKNGKTGGWSESIRDENNEKTTRTTACWNIETQNHKHRCKLTPVKYAIKVFLTGDKYRKMAGCEWKLKGEPKRPCSEDIIVVVNKNDGKKMAAQIYISSDENEFETVPLEIDGITEKLIVGFGDSFGSGQGNPDLPARFTGISDTDSHSKSEGWNDEQVARLRPIRQKPLLEGKGTTRTDAVWIDRLCHRSAYSFQTRTALHYALKNPKEATIFANYSCDGAVITDVFSTAKMGNDPVFPINFQTKPKGNINCLDYDTDFQKFGKKSASEKRKIKKKCKLERYVKPQLVQFYDDFCKGGLSKKSIEFVKNHRNKPEEKPGFFAQLFGRKIEKIKIADYKCLTDRVFKKVPDIVLLSASGNDAQFAKMVATIFVSDPLVKAGQLPFVDATVDLKDVLKSLKKGNERAKKIQTDFVALAKEFKDIGIEPGNVILTGYPTPVNKEECTEINTQSKIYRSLSADTERLKMVTEDILPILDGIMKSSADKAGWAFIKNEDFQGEFEKHGICTGNDDEFIVPSDIDKYGRPSLGAGNSWGVYKKRKRWFLTMDDAYLFINQIVRKPLEGKVDKGAAKRFYVGASGAIHPNSYGAAHMADITYKKITTDVMPPKQ